MSIISEKIKIIRQRLPRSVTLLAVTKQQSIENILEAYDAGLRSFGENYVQEALLKIQAFKTGSPIGSGMMTVGDIEWHFIGRIQSNKTKLIAENFDWVQTVCNEAQARRLNDQRPESLPLLNICIQVNVDGDPAKAGASLKELQTLATFVKAQKNLKLRGLMTIPENTNDPEKNKTTFLMLRKGFDDLNARDFKLDILSMGMSHDFETAIAAGSTMIRIGTVIFGARSAHARD